MKIKLNENDWLKLRDFNKKIAVSIHKKLPSDWHLSIDDIEGAVYDAFIKLLNNYESGAMSATSYCWQYGERYAYRDLMREYARLKKQEEIVDWDYDEETDGEECRHRHGVYDAPALVVDEREKQMTKDEVKQLMAKANVIDALIMRLMMEGKTQQEIADEIGLSRSAVLKRMKGLKKYMGDE